MSDLAQIMTRNIREGDLIRTERPGGTRGKGTGWLAVEYIARRDGDYYWEPGEGVAYFLMDRPVVLPTAVYSLVVPPAEERYRSAPIVLDVSDVTGALCWMVGISRKNVEEVEKLVANCGWRVIPGPETIEGVTE